MQRKILLTLTAASTLALAALLGGSLWSTASIVKSNATAPSADHRGADAGRAATRVTAAGVSRRIEEGWE